MNRPEGVDLARRLIAECDAVVENFTPRVMENFGLSWAVVHQLNPRAVIKGFQMMGVDTSPWGA